MSLVEQVPYYYTQGSASTAALLLIKTNDTTGPGLWQSVVAGRRAGIHVHREVKTPHRQLPARRTGDLQDIYPRARSSEELIPFHSIYPIEAN